MLPVKLKAPSDYREVWRGGVLQIMITRACDLSCVGCTQGSNLAGKPTIMSPEQFRVACESLQGYTGVIGIFGGNPCMHPDFEEICWILAQYFPKEQRGLWSNNLGKHGATCRETFNPGVSNLNAHGIIPAYMQMQREWPESYPKGTGDSRHSPPFVALKDMHDLTDERRWQLIQTCDINMLWSALIGVFRGELRGWFCELAGSQSMLHEAEPNYPDTGLQVVPGWWKHSMEAFEGQVRKHCMECGIPLRGSGDLSQGHHEHVSETHISIAKFKKPKFLTMVTTTKELGGTVPHATDYIENGLIQ